MKKTAIDWLVEHLNSQYGIYIEHLSVTDKAKAMEKEQIMNAYRWGRNEIHRQQYDFPTHEEKHYDEFYNPNTKFKHGQ